MRTPRLASLSGLASRPRRGRREPHRGSKGSANVAEVVILIRSGDRGRRVYDRSGVAARASASRRPGRTRPITAAAAIAAAKAPIAHAGDACWTSRPSQRRQRRQRGRRHEHGVGDPAAHVLRRAAQHHGHGRARLAPYVRASVAAHAASSCPSATIPGSAAEAAGSKMAPAPPSTTRPRERPARTRDAARSGGRARPAGRPASCRRRSSSAAGRTGPRVPRRAAARRRR